MTSQEHAAGAGDASGEDRPWWATDDPAGHQRTEKGGQGEHVRPAWMDAVEAIDGAFRAATKGAKGAADRVQDVADGLQGHVDGVENGATKPGSGGGSGSGGSDGSGGGSGSGGGEVPGDHRHGAIDAYCHLCPVCTLLRALEEVRPEVLVHLTEAARHLTMAAKAVIDAQADRMGPEQGFESITLDD